MSMRWSALFCVTSDGTEAAFVASYTASGEHRWSLSSSTTSNGWAQARAIAFDPSGSSPKVHITGVIGGTVNFDDGRDLESAGLHDIFIASFDAESGEHLASRRWGGYWADGIAVDPSGNLYITGSFSGTVDFGGFSLTSNGNTDVLIASYPPAPSYESDHARWATGLGGASSEEGRAIFVDGSGNVYVTGYFSGRANFRGGRTRIGRLAGRLPRIVHAERDTSLLDARRGEL